jgi:glycosyltransferase involved in cell wall biosynthesis
MATLFVATAEQEAETIRRVGLRQPIAIIPNGIQIPIRKHRIVKASETRYALFLSRIHPVKGLLNLIAAWDRVRPKGWRMIVAGPDEDSHRSEVEQAVIDAGLEQSFIFLGPVKGNAKDELYRQADLFILPTLSENFGVVVAEALSYGIPVITTHNAPWEVLSRQDCGWWVESDIGSLANALRNATSISDLQRSEMGTRGRSFVKRELSWPKIAGQMIAVYDWILGVGIKPSCIIN